MVPTRRELRPLELAIHYAARKGCPLTRREHEGRSAPLILAVTHGNATISEERDLNTLAVVR